ncbi:MAG: glycosyltransferase [Victivallaceae bacterium]|nr:glycosyltransferase [Victivallaceae bacterium]
MRIVFLAAVNYHSILSGRTRRLAETYARNGHEVWYVNLPSLRYCFAFLAGNEAHNGVNVVSLPPFPGGWRIMRTLPGRFITAWFRHLLKKRVPLCSRTLFIISSAWWTELVCGIKEGRFIYDCLDYISVMAPARYESDARILEKRLLRKVDGLCTVSPGLLQYYQTTGKKCAVVPNAVPEEWLKPYEPVNLPGRGGRPKIGFVGSLSVWVDIELIRNVAQLLPEYDFIIIGPTAKGIPAHKVLAGNNIFQLASIPYEKVPFLMTSFDVAIIPFKNNVISRNADPLKVYEYLACGCPVVSTLPFNPDLPLAAANSLQEFAAEIRKAVGRGSFSTEEITAILSRHTWNTRAKQLLDFAKGLYDE